MTETATKGRAATLVGRDQPGSVHVTLGFDHGKRVMEREEAYNQYRVRWNGEEITVSTIADRYRHSEGLSPWRVGRVETRYAVALSDLGRQRVREALTPVILAWVESDEYRTARESAFVHALKRELAEERYDADRPAKAIDAFRAELSPESLRKLILASNHLAHFLAALEDLS